MRHALLTALFLMLAAPAAGQDPAPPPTSSPALVAAAPDLAAVPGLTLVGYPVRGRSSRSIRESINEGRPAGDGDRFDGRTQFRYETRWRANAAGGCDPSSVEVTTTFIVTMPELTTRPTLERRDRENWDRYFNALIAHEHNHVRIALAGQDQLRTYLRNAPNCATMQAAQEQITVQINEAQRAYDRNTRHGATEGAHFP